MQLAPSFHILACQVAWELQGAKANRGMHGWIASRIPNTLRNSTVATCGMQKIFVAQWLDDQSCMKQ
jgi:hypothetical protein